MADKRMFSKKIIDSDAFLDMPATARLLYYDLAMRADDDGFVNSPKKIMRIVGSSQDDMNVLIARKFIIPFESGIVVIKHWRIHNYIRKDTYHETAYSDEKSQLTVKTNGSYTLKTDALCDSVDGSSTGRPRVVDADKIRLDKNNTKEKEIKEKEKRYGTFSNVRLSDEEYQKAKEKYPDLADEMIEQLSEYMASKGKHYKSHYATVLAWCRKRKDGRNDFVGGNGRSVQGTTGTPGAEKDYDKW